MWWYYKKVYVRYSVVLKSDTQYAYVYRYRLEDSEKKMCMYSV